MKRTFANPTMDIKQFRHENILTSSGVGENEGITAAEAMAEKAASVNITEVVKLTF